MVLSSSLSSAAASPDTGGDSGCVLSRMLHLLQDGPERRAGIWRLRLLTPTRARIEDIMAHRVIGRMGGGSHLLNRRWRGNLVCCTRSYNRIGWIQSLGYTACVSYNFSLRCGLFICLGKEMVFMGSGWIRLDQGALRGKAYLLVLLVAFCVDWVGLHG